MASRGGSTGKGCVQINGSGNSSKGRFFCGTHNVMYDWLITVKSGRFVLGTLTCTYLPEK